MSGIASATLCPILSLLLTFALASRPASAAEPEAGKPFSASGFVCRTISDRSVAVVTPLSGVFVPGAPVRFFDDAGEVFATGTVRSAYSDLAYVAVDNVPDGLPEKGFVVSAGSGDNEAKLLCGYSRNLPMVLEKGRDGGHSVPPNVIRIKYHDDSTKPVWFRHYKHEMECRTCHHRQPDASCDSCHPIRRVTGNPERCLREICTGCHREHPGRTSECAWCHKEDSPPVTR